VQGLRTRAQFQTAMAGTVKARSAHFALHYCRFEGASPTQVPAPTSGAFSKAVDWDRPAIGALVPKRWAKRAVTRNTIKRQIFNVSQLYEQHLAPGAHVVRLRSAFDIRLFPSATSAQLRHAVRQELLDLFSRGAQQRAEPAP